MSIKSSKSIINGEKSDEQHEILLNQTTELGPNVLKDSKFEALLSPFDVEWIFGFDVTVPVINLTTEDKRRIFYSATNVGILYNYCKKEMIHLRGHQSKIVSATADKSGRWLATADNGEENVILIWDTFTQELMWTIFNHASGYDLYLITLSPKGRLLVTISSENEITIDFWSWTYGNDKPDDSYQHDSSFGAPKAVEFHPNKEEHIMIVFERAVLFFRWDRHQRKVSQPIIPKVSLSFSNIGHYTDGTYADFCHECFVSTSKGQILVFGNSIFTKNFNLEELDNDKMYIKNIKISKGVVNCITSTDEVIITGDSNGLLIFFDKHLKLLYWFSKIVTNPIRSISFKLNPRKYTLDTSKHVAEDVHTGIIPDCEDRSEEYETLMLQNVPKDASLENRPLIMRDFFITTQNGTIYLVNFVKKEFIPLFTNADNYVSAIDVHDQLPYLLIAYTKGHLVLINYQTHEEVISTVLPETENDATVTAVKFSPQCLHLACGKSNGELWLLQPALLAEIYVEPFRFSTNKVIKIVFSEDSLQMAYYDDNMAVYGFYYDTETEDWVFKGKVRTHYKDICNILFLDEEPYGLYTAGKDRHLIKYTDLSPNEDEIDILSRDRIEQQDIPLYFTSYPRKKASRTGYFLVADDKHKFKIISTTTVMTTSVYLGPAYGCFKDSPVCKMEFLPKSNKRFLIFMNKKQIGIQLMPIDGNPYKYVGCLGHPEELLDFQMSYDGKYIFTIGKHDRSVFMWRVKVQSVEILHDLGGVELQPFYCLLEGGRGGFLFQEMRDLFYYMQILQQGEHVCAPRMITNYINFGELPDLMRACGYYPSEYEIENLLTDLRYKDFDDTGILKDRSTFCEFVKLFINHKPAYGYTIEHLERSFETITTFAEDYGPPEMSKEDFIEAITTTGEQVSSEQIYRCLVTLTHADVCEEEESFGEKDFSFLPDTIGFDEYAEDILGIDLSTVERQNEDYDDDDGGYRGYGYY